MLKHSINHTGAVLASRMDGTSFLFHSEGRNRLEKEKKKKKTLLNQLSLDFLQPFLVFNRCNSSDPYRELRNPLSVCSWRLTMGNVCKKDPETSKSNFLRGKKTDAEPKICCGRWRSPMPVSSAAGYSRSPTRADEPRAHAGRLDGLVSRLCVDVFRDDADLKVIKPTRRGSEEGGH